MKPVVVRNIQRADAEAIAALAGLGVVDRARGAWAASA